MTSFTLYEAETTRSCSGCTACCKILPTKELDKPANTRCRHQRSGKGCSIYNARPFGCRTFSCRWLMAPQETAGLSRPDRSHYVVDPSPDFVTMRDSETGAETRVPVLQIWVDPLFRDAHRDAALRAYIDRMGKAHGMAALIRFGSMDAIFLAPPSIASDGQWHERTSGVTETEHSAADKMAVFQTGRLAGHVEEPAR